MSSLSDAPMSDAPVSDSQETSSTRDDAQWIAAQKEEADFWGNCLNLRTWHEFVKQEMYGREMQLIADYNVSGEYNMQGKSVLDIGGGPVSMTLRCFNASRLTVVDPIAWPQSVLRRYQNFGIDFIQCAGEQLGVKMTRYVDEVWIYNVLQHVVDPNLVLNQAKACLKPDGRLRIFEWINIPADTCHPNVLTPESIANGLSGMRLIHLAIPRLNEYWTPNAQAFVGVFSL